MTFQTKISDSSIRGEGYPSHLWMVCRKTRHIHAILLVLISLTSGGAFVSSLVTPLQSSSPPSTASPANNQPNKLFSWNHATMVATSISGQLFQKALPKALQCLYHPFLYGLASGKLPRGTFQNYVGQDYFFLHSFSDAYLKAGAILKARGDTAGAETFSTLAAGVADELNLHNSYAMKWGVDLAEVKSQSATTSYVSFLERTTSMEGQKISTICAAMAPCMRLYAYLGSTLKRALPSGGHAVDNPYAEWIETYAAHDFAGLAVTLEDLLDRYAAEEGASFDELSVPFMTAMDLEYAFFDAQPGTDAVIVPSTSPKIFAVDFDQTLTVQDTSSVIAHLSLSAMPSESARSQRTADWDAVASSFYAKYEAKLAELLPSECVIGGFSLDGLLTFCTAMSQFDQEALLPVQEGGFLSGVTPEALRGAASSIAMQASSLETLRKAAASGASLHIVSVNWSQDLIKGALQSVPAFELLSPNLAFEGGVSTGSLVPGGISGSLDKSELIKKLRAKGGKTVYVGDSVTDVLGLLEADVGVIVGQSKSLRKVLEAYGVKVKPMVGAVLPGGAQGALTGVLYEAQSWDDVAHAMFGGV